MTSTTRESTRDARRAAILQLLDRPQAVRSQAELAALLADEGHEANQATLSRDLRDLGVVKGASGYSLPNGDAPEARDANARLLVALRQFLDSALPAQNQVVLRTPPGGAQPLARALDLAPQGGILGTLAGDDTILVITPDTRTARRVAQWLKDRS